MKNSLGSLVAIALTALTLIAFNAQSVVPPPLPQWNFNGANPTIPSAGTGSWHTFGGVTNTLASGAGSSDPLGTGDQALSLTGFPKATNVSALAGIEFSANTLGYRDLAFRFDLRATSTANRNILVQYSVDEGASYIDGSRFVLTNAGAFQNGLMLDFREVPEVVDQPHLRVRLISGVGSSDRFEGVTGNYSPSGTWRLDQVMFLGEPLVPIPPITPVASPLITFTNYITGRFHLGEPATNTFAELALRPGETLRLEIGARDTNNLPITLRPLNGETMEWWQLPTHEASDAQGIFTYTASEGDAGQTLSIGLSIENGSTNTRWWTLYFPTPAERQVMISEFLANPPSGTLEFVELVQLSSHPTDLSGWTLGDASSIRHRFGSGAVMRGGQAMVIFGGFDALPSPVAKAEFLSASAGGLSLNNGGDAVVLRNAQSNLIERVVYQAADLVARSSLVREPMPDGAYRSHSSLGNEAWSPGEFIAGHPWPVIDAEVQPGVSVRFAGGSSGEVELEWTPLAGRVARVLRTTDLESPFEAIAQDLTDGVYADPIVTPEAFYRVEWQ